MDGKTRVFLKHDSGVVRERGGCKSVTKDGNELFFIGNGQNLGFEGVYEILLPIKNFVIRIMSHKSKQILTSFFVCFRTLVII